MEEWISFCLTVSTVRDFFEELSGQGLRGMRKVVPLHSQSREGYAPEVLRQRSGRADSEKEFSRSLAGMKIFRTFALTSPPEGLEMLKKEIIDIKIRQGHRPS